MFSSSGPVYEWPSGILNSEDIHKQFITDDASVTFKNISDKKLENMNWSEYITYTEVQKTMTNNFSTVPIATGFDHSNISKIIAFT